MRPTGNGSKGLPATPEALRAYAQRVLRPGQVQSFGCVVLVASEASYAVTGAEPGVVLGVSENAESLPGCTRTRSWTITFSTPSRLRLRRRACRGNSSALSLRTATSRRKRRSSSRFVRTRSVKLYAIAHTTEEGHVVDLEPIDEGSDRMLEGLFDRSRWRRCR